MNRYPFEATEEEIEQFYIDYLHVPWDQPCPYCGRVNCHLNPCEWAYDEKITGGKDEY